MTDRTCRGSSITPRKQVTRTPSSGTVRPPDETQPVLAPTARRLPTSVSCSSTKADKAKAKTQIDQAETFDQLMDAERVAAAAYWERWTAIPIRFALRDQERVADHWRSFCW